MIAITIDDDTDEAKEHAVIKVAAAHGLSPLELIARHGVVFTVRPRRRWSGRQGVDEWSPLYRPNLRGR